MTERFDVFISHNSKDKSAVRKLAQELQWRKLKVWLDEEQLVPGAPWRSGLEAGILDSKTAAVLIGKDGLGPWETPEMEVCLHEAVMKNKRIIPVLLTGAPSQPELPSFLKRYTWIDLRSGLNEEGLDRLEWGITGKKPFKIKHGNSDINADKSDLVAEEKKTSPKAKTKDIAPDAYTPVYKKLHLQKNGTSPLSANKLWLVIFSLGIVFVLIMVLPRKGTDGSVNKSQGSIGASSKENGHLSPLVNVKFEIDPPDAELSITTQDGKTQVCLKRQTCEFKAQFGALLNWKAEKKGYQTNEGTYEVGKAGMEDPYPISLHKIYE